MKQLGLKRGLNVTAINKLIVLGFSCLLLMNITHADKVRCANPNGTTFNEISTCLYEDYQFYDKQLNVVYKRKLSSLSSYKKSKLRLSELKWIQTRDRECNALVDELNYGKESHFAATECKTDMTKERIKYIKNYK